ncbi:hypothetical protein RUM43_007485 [Polyplax serrata]|uniref:Leucine-rich repeat and WD repeat-containing protein 1 WD domain-containing protein n=1 Tax=Polyplax serrata TaxID=468196 RepID=A0AAN8P8L5_POLSC
MTSSEELSDEEEFEINFNPKYFLRCHSKHRKDAADVQTNVWECAFQPQGSSKYGETSNIVATCGGNSICFIDIKTGKVMKKYYASKSGENFFTLSWTRIKGHNILAAGGSVQTINFITYDEGYCFHEEKFDRSIIGVKVGITSIRFHPVVTNILYCSCSSGKVLVMNIGCPTKPDYNIDIQILQQYEVHCEVFLLVYYLNKELILGTSDDGIYCWRGNPDIMGSSKVGNHRVLLQFPGRPLALTNAPSLVDTVEVLENGFIASKCALRGAIYIWNIEKVIKDSIKEDLTIRITPLYQLEWSNTDNYFMYLGYDKGCKYLACGDDKGAIWTYNIKNLIENTDTINPVQSMIKPTTIFEWPNLEDAYASRKRKLNLNVYDIVINKTILSYNSEYLVAVTNKNMVCIWKKKTKSKKK